MHSFFLCFPPCWACSLPFSPTSWDRFTWDVSYGSKTVCLHVAVFHCWQNNLHHPRNILLQMRYLSKVLHTPCVSLGNNAATICHFNLAFFLTAWVIRFLFYIVGFFGGLLSRPLHRSERTAPSFGFPSPHLPFCFVYPSLCVSTPQSVAFLCQHHQTVESE